MRKYLVLLFISILVTCLTACSNSQQPVQSEEMKYSQQPVADIAPQQYNSEELFIKAVKEGSIASEFRPEKIDCYYRPKVVPEGATLNYVEVYISYITLIYTFDKADKNNVTKQIKYIWYRNFDDPEAYMNNEIEKRGYQIVQFEGAKSNISFLANNDFNAEKANKEESGRPNWDFLFVQDGKCFAGVVPWTFEEKDIAKYFDMEKVTIE